ncbi:hypothetical protein [Enterococcus pingfangensis]|uniref:hypothetical protein n=1 Tax=Enterococcus pingfangensis TaxID=2559924 RepID=UPI001FE4A937|nr:hypothetical protein [Enterococcus pingfangensis]
MIREQIHKKMTVTTPNKAQDTKKEAQKLLDKKIDEGRKKSNSTKNNAGMREISIPKKAVDIYNELLERNPKGHFLFQITKGTPFQITAINTYLRDRKKTNGN